nr:MULTISPECIES: LytR C-terminal domain-containing protein [Microbacterium]
MLATGRFSPGAEAPVPVPDAPAVEAVVDTSYSVLVLNATPEDGLAGAMSDTIIAAGWSADDIIAGEAGSDDFPTTTVYFPTVDDEGAARGLAEVIGGAEVALNDSYQPADDPDTADVDESQARQLVVVIGLDRMTPTPQA